CPPQHRRADIQNRPRTSRRTAAANAVALVVEADRAPEDQPAPGLGPVRMRRIEPLVEPIRIEVVVAERPYARGEESPVERDPEAENVEARRARMRVRPMPIPRVLPGEPAQPGEQVSGRRRHDQGADGG